MRELPRAFKVTSRLHTHTGSLTRHPGVFYGVQASQSRSFATESVEKSPVHKETLVKENREEMSGDKSKKNTGGEEGNNKKQKDAWDKMQSIGQWAMAGAVIGGTSFGVYQFYKNKNFDINMKKVDRGIKIISEFDKVSKGLNALRQELFELSFLNKKGEIDEKEFIKLRGKIDQLTSTACRIILYRHTDVIDTGFKNVVATEIYPAFMQAITAIWDFETKCTFSPKDTFLSCYTAKGINYDSTFKEKSDYLIYMIKATHSLVQISRKEVMDSLKTIEDKNTLNFPKELSEKGVLPKGALAMVETGQTMSIQNYIQSRIDASKHSASLKRK